jgi:hypothetical protein
MTAMNERYFLDAFAGDGREMVQPLRGACLLGTHPRPVRRATARQLVSMFLESGHSTHSAAGNTLWVVLAYCLGQGIPFTLRAEPGSGYYIEKIGPALATK